MPIGKLFRGCFGNFVKTSGVHIVDKPTNACLDWDKRIRFDAVDALTNIGFEVGESFGSPRWLDSDLLADLLFECVVGECEHATVSVMDQNDLCRAQQPLADGWGEMEK